MVPLALTALTVVRYGGSLEYPFPPPPDPASSSPLLRLLASETSPDSSPLSFFVSESLL